MSESLKTLQTTWQKVLTESAQTLTSWGVCVWWHACVSRARLSVVFVTVTQAGDSHHHFKLQQWTYAVCFGKANRFLKAEQTMFPAGFSLFPGCGARQVGWKKNLPDIPANFFGYRWDEG